LTFAACRIVHSPKIETDNICPSAS